ncbi:conjugal transfer protein [Streptomyces sp. TLI_105]|uniref:conjugal transfer protein n=1 Tax=Streptomyces sp. TLI_105 TaxID=1881019 RepID=UPI000896404F|nr:conjugal transfer protein [Streptomyces sp. TLI_105]SEB59063.1 Conjugative transposon protein TcpC [Streptomyces sp. TLI_105]
MARLGPDRARPAVGRARLPLGSHHVRVPGAETAPPAPAASGGQGAAGFARLFVAAYLSAGRGDEPKLAAYYPSAADLQLDGVSGRHRGEQLTVVRLRQTDTPVWSVTVAARVTGAQPTATPSTQPSASSSPSAAADAVRYFQVSVATAPGAGGTTAYTALALPAELAAPERAKTPELVYGAMHPALPTDPRTQAVTSFLTAYLTRAGAQLDRYLAPGTRLTAPSPAPYSGIAVDQLAAEGEAGGELVVSVPGDGTTLHLLVTLRATGQDGVRLPLAYALTLKARAGRWKIASLDGAPSITSPNPAPTASGAPGPATAPAA